MMVVDTTTIMLPKPGSPKEAGRRTLLAEFLRSRRARLAPEEVGLPAGTHRRVPGLRREEVAVLADVGITWYTWLEQGRAIRMAPATLERIADALRLDRHERAYLSRLVFFDPAAAGWNVPIPARVAEVVRSYAAGAAYVLGPRWDVLAWNDFFSRVFGFPGDSPGNNALRHAFLDSHVPELVVDWPSQARQIVAAFRASYAQHAGDEAFEELIAELLRESPIFAELWNESSTVLSPTEGRSARLQHPTLGSIFYEMVTLLIPEVPHVTVVFGVLDADKSKVE